MTKEQKQRIKELECEFEIIDEIKIEYIYSEVYNINRVSKKQVIFGNVDPEDNPDFKIEIKETESNNISTHYFYKENDIHFYEELNRNYKSYTGKLLKVIRYKICFKKPFYSYDKKFTPPIVKKDINWQKIKEQISFIGPYFEWEDPNLEVGILFIISDINKTVNGGFVDEKIYSENLMYPHIMEPHDEYVIAGLRSTIFEMRRRKIPVKHITYCTFNYRVSECNLLKSPYGYSCSSYDLTIKSDSNQLLKRKITATEYQYIFRSSPKNRELIIGNLVEMIKFNVIFDWHFFKYTEKKLDGSQIITEDCKYPSSIPILEMDKGKKIITNSVQSDFIFKNGREPYYYLQEHIIKTFELINRNEVGGFIKI